MLISDQREITFDALALLAVIANSPRMTQAIGLPAIAPEGARFDLDTGAVTLFYGVNGRSIALQAAPLTALLISYCLRVGIRVPRKIERGVRVDRAAAVLVFATNYPIPPITIAPERTRQTDQSQAPLSGAAVSLPIRGASEV